MTLHPAPLHPDVPRLAVASRSQAVGVDQSRVARLVRELLIAIGEDPNREGLRLTPERVAQSWAELLSGTSADASAPLDRVIPLRDADDLAPAASGVVLLRDLRFRSVCEHHLLPFAGCAHVAYLPGADVVGFGSLARVIEILSCRLQVQERLGEEVASTIASALAPRGVLVVLDAVHGCLTMRGSAQPRSSTLTIAARGVYTDPVARAEIVSLIGSTGRKG